MGVDFFNHIYKQNKKRIFLHVKLLGFYLGEKIDCFCCCFSHDLKFFIHAEIEFELFGNISKHKREKSMRIQNHGLFGLFY